MHSKRISLAAVVTALLIVCELAAPAVVASSEARAQTLSVASFPEGTISKIFTRLVSLARNETEHQRMFGQPLRNPRELESIRAAALQYGFTEVRPQTTTTHANESFLQQYTSPTSGIMIVVGHNNNGHFVFPDGSQVDLSTVAANPQKLLVILSCESAKYSNGQYVGVPGVLTYDTAYRTADLLQEKIQLLDVVTYTTVAVALDQALAQVKKENLTKTTAIITIGVVGVGTPVVIISISGPPE